MATLDDREPAVRWPTSWGRARGATPEMAMRRRRSKAYSDDRKGELTFAAARPGAIPKARMPWKAATWDGAVQRDPPAFAQTIQQMQTAQVIGRSRTQRLPALQLVETRSQAAAVVSRCPVSARQIRSRSTTTPTTPRPSEATPWRRASPVVPTSPSGGGILRRRPTGAAAATGWFGADTTGRFGIRWPRFRWPVLCPFKTDDGG